MKSKVKGEFRTFSYATTSASKKPCNKAKAHHNGCRDMDAIAKDFLPLPLKKMIAIVRRKMYRLVKVINSTVEGE